ncbi:hypothetical protein EMCRGX_G026096 [Ephydatia muelleri]
MALRASGERIKEAIRSGKAELLQIKADDLKKIIGPEGYNPLHWACHYGQVKTLQRIIDSDVDVSSTTKYGWSGLHISAIRGHTECFQVGLRITHATEVSLLKHRYPPMQVLLEAGVDTAQRDSRGYRTERGKTIRLHAAVLTNPTNEKDKDNKNGLLHLTQADPNVRDARGWTPSHHAAFHGRLSAMQTLLQAGTDMMLKDSKGCTPAHYAAMEGHTDCLRLLVSNSTDLIGLLHTKNNNGLTPLACALQHHKTQSIEYLRSIEQEVTSPKTEYPAHVMCCHGDLAHMKSLIGQGAVSINGRDDAGDTLAHKAAIHDQLECLLWLIQNGADVSLVNSLGETPYDLAVQYRHRACSNLLARSLEHVYPFWYTPRWKRQVYCHKTVDPTPWGTEDLCCGTKGLYSTVTGMPYSTVTGMYRYRSARDHYRCPDNIWEEFEMEAKEDEHKNCVSKLTASLEYEKQRRELVEEELDTTRRQLHCAMTRLLHLRIAGPQTMPENVQTVKEG